jgi:hypothetical protein
MNMTKKPPVYPPQTEGVLDAKQARRLAQVSEHYPRFKGLFLRCYRGAGPRQCIKAFCLECNGWEPAAIRDCTATACPLFRIRPYQVAVAKGEEAGA